MNRPGFWRLTAAHVSYQNKLFRRTPVAAFFSTVLPLVMLVLLEAVLGDDTFETDYGVLSAAQFYAPALAVFAVASATYTNIGIFLSTQRDDGILKRHRGTPLPTGALIGGVIGSAILIATASAVLMIGVGVVFYDLSVDGSRVPAIVLTFLVGVTCFAALGVALAVFAPSAASAPAVANATILPLATISGVFVSLEDESASWLTFVGDLFPMRHFIQAFGAGFSPDPDAGAVQWDRLAVMAVWGVAAAAFAHRRFSWEVRGASARRRGRAHSVAGE